MKRNKFIFIVLILILSISGIVSAAGDDDYYWSNLNANPLKNHPPRAMTIYIDAEEAPVHLFRLSTIHADSGEKTGSVSIWMGDQQVGSWPWVRQIGYGISYVYQVADVDMVLLPGYEYTIKVSDEDSWCYNAQSENRGMVELIGERLDNFNSGTADDACATPDPNIGIVLNDEKVILTDSEGIAVPPLVYSGTLYIPAQIIPSIPGVDVKWDDGMHILYITADGEDKTPQNGINYALLASKISGDYKNAGLILKDGSLYVVGNGYLGNGEDSAGEIVWVADDVKDVSISAGYYALVKKDGSLWTWGSYSRNSWPYVLGYKGTENALKPVHITDNVEKVSMGNGHYAFIKSDGTLWIWGENQNGALGFEIYFEGKGIDDLKEPTYLMDNVADVKCGNISGSGGGSGQFTLVLKKDGTLWTFGDNSRGELGTGLTDLRWAEKYGRRRPCTYIPQLIMKNVVSIETGKATAAAVTADGGVWTWGLNNEGQLGNGGVYNALAPERDVDEGTIPCQSSPVKILDDGVAVSMGMNHGAVLKSDGTVWCWGDNWVGQLGNGEKSKSPGSAVPVKAHIEDVVAINAGDEYTLAVKSDGTIWGWGAISHVFNSPEPVQLFADLPRMDVK